MDMTLDASAASSPPRLVNGVFMGGGAKSIAYTGALYAVHQRGMWFGSVAGSSAGAIVSALIASGLEPDELEDAIPAGLTAASSPLAARAAKVIVGHAHSVFQDKGLRTWLDSTMAAKIGKTDGTPVTFAELHAATRIELYVLAVDLANGLPLVFSRRTTPGVDVAGAVVASGSIPAAFPAGRAVVRRGDDGAMVHALIDGSAWAVYPSFVFQDRSFRAWLRGEAFTVGTATDADDAGLALEEQRPLIGFVLGDPEPLEHHDAVSFVPLDGLDINRRFDRGPTFTSPKRFSYFFGSLLSSDWARLVLGVGLVLWVALSVAMLPLAFRRFAGWLADATPAFLDVLYPFVLVGSLGVVVATMVSSVALIAVALLAGRIVADTLLPAARAVYGVPGDTPPWIGLGEDSVVLHVPDDGLHTVDFDVDLALRAQVIATALDGVGRQLDDAVIERRLDALFEGRTPEQVPYRRGERPAPIAPFDERSSVGEIVALVVVAIVVGVVAWFAANSAGTDQIGLILVGVVAGLASVGAAGWYVGGRAARRAAGRSASGVTALTLPSIRAARLVITAGCGLLVAGAVMSWVAMDDRAGHTEQAEVVEATRNAPCASSDPDCAENRYTVEYTELVGADRVVRPVEIDSDRHLRLGEQVFVDPTEQQLVGALDDPLFAVSLVSWVLAVGLITSGVRSLRWAQRCERLSRFVAERTPG
jgi:hypothetical protein